MEQLTLVQSDVVQEPQMGNLSWPGEHYEKCRASNQRGGRHQGPEKQKWILEGGGEWGSKKGSGIPKNNLLLVGGTHARQLKRGSRVT